MYSRCNLTKLVFFVFALIIVMSAVSWGQSKALQEVVYLKSGGIIRGIIIEQVPNESIKIQTSDGNVFVYKMDEISRIAKEETTASRTGTMQQSSNPTGSKKEPAMAFLLSFLLPGGGQFYNGQIGKGVAMLALTAGGYVLFFVELPSSHYGSNYYYDPYSNEYDYNYHYNEEGSAALSYGGLALAGLTAIWSMIDAPLTASSLNRERGYGALPEQRKGLSLAFCDMGKGKGFAPGLKLKLVF
jgi:hypothetical protein